MNNLKVIEERISPYFIFHECKNGLVCVASKSDDSFISNISKEDALKLIEERDEVIDLLEELSYKCEKAFNDVWYK